MARDWNLGLKDDRGAPLTLGDLAAGVRHDRKKGRFSLSGLQVLGYAGMAFSVWWMATGGWQMSTRDVLIGGCAYGLVGVAMALSWRYGTPSLRRRVWAPRAWACAHGACGGCGYGLREVVPGEDGCVACPECGAAWHRDRWTMAGRDPLENRRFVGMVTGAMWMPDVDDRGVPCDEASGWYPPWAWSDRVDAAVRQAVRDEVAGRAWWRFAVGSLLIVAAWIIAVCVVMVVRDPLPGDWWVDFTLLAVVSALIGSGVAFQLYRSAGRAADRRGASLRAGRCANCGEELAGAAGFDGCAPCSKCRRAWKRDVPAAP